MAKHSQSKSNGTYSKKAQRVVRAKARKAAFDALSPEQQRDQMAINKQEYHYWHDSETHLNGGESA